MGADGGHPAVVQDDDAVGVLDGGDAVGDDEDGAVAGGSEELPDDAGLAAFVDRAGGLVED